LPHTVEPLSCLGLFKFVTFTLHYITCRVYSIRKHSSQKRDGRAIVVNHRGTETKAFKHIRLRCMRCVNENCKKCSWQAANHGCHCFDRAFLLAGACVCCVKCTCVSCAFRLLNARNASAIAFEWKPGLTLMHYNISQTLLATLLITVHCTTDKYRPCKHTTFTVT